GDTPRHYWLVHPLLLLYFTQVRTAVNLLTPFSARMLLIPQNRVANLEEKLAGGDWLVRKSNNQVTLH
ncbi:hypothetical protein, partial [Chlorogloea sp. CCALA 695]|uniref:hypothetical protein n=1 Tax=Chlorogloea sp. CCALA 695 TaxID=2107693 RepID=UPI000D4A9B54